MSNLQKCCDRRAYLWSMNLSIVCMFMFGLFTFPGWAVIEHKCDCGQMFSSAALLTRHTSLAHTPPRIRRRRSPPPPPDVDPIPEDKPKPPSLDKPSTSTASGKSTSNRKLSSIRSEPTTSGSRNFHKPKEPARSTRRSAAQAGVPIPDKMRRLMLKNNK